MADYDFIQTRQEIIERAFRIVGDLPLGESLSGEASQQAILVLNSIVKEWQTRGTFLWNQITGTLTVSANPTSMSSATCPPIAIDQAYLRVSNIDTPLEQISWTDYQKIEDKTTTGTITTFAFQPYDAATGNPYMYVYPVPSASSTIFYLTVTKAEDWDTDGGSADMPVRFQEALTYALASKLADEYGLPLNEKVDLRNQAAILFNDAKRSDREHSDNEFVRGSYE